MRINLILLKEKVYPLLLKKNYIFTILTKGKESWFTFIKKNNIYLQVYLKEKGILRFSKRDFYKFI